MVLTTTQHRRMYGTSQPFRSAVTVLSVSKSRTAVNHAVLLTQDGVFQKETGIPYNKMLFYDDEDRNVHRVRVPCSSVDMSGCASQTSLCIMHLLAPDYPGTAGVKAGGDFCVSLHTRRGVYQHSERRFASLQ